jgi:hypothetical protein
VAFKRRVTLSFVRSFRSFTKIHDPKLWATLLVPILLLPSVTTVRGETTARQSQPTQVLDLNAIQRAGRAGDRSVIPVLRQRLRTEKDVTTIELLRISLAQLGDVGQMQMLLCESRNARMEWGPWHLADVGGWYAIQGISFLLSERWRAEKKRYADEILVRNGDVIIWPDENLLVLRDLMGVVPNAPSELVVRESRPDPNEHRLFEQISARRAQLNKDWPVWIDVHRAELQTLEPKGAGVDFSIGACDMGKGKPRRKIVEK